jgi:hypothetical protein
MSDLPQQKPTQKLIVALAAYAVLMALCCVFVTGKILLAVLIVFVGLAAKTVIAWKAGW